MKKIFHEYHILTNEERMQMSQVGMIVFDTNVILDFYSYGADTLNDYFKVLSELKHRSQLWMPHRVGFEFFENRTGIISKQKQAYDNILSYINTPMSKLSELMGTSVVHAHLDFDDILTKYKTATNDLISEIQSAKDKHPDQLGRDKILEKLELIIDDSMIGEPYSNDHMAGLIKEGEIRYDKKIPPGFKDSKKPNNNDKQNSYRKYGDLIIWKQMIDKAKECKAPIIFVTNDSKIDWVYYDSGKRRMGPQTALRKEMYDEAGVDFDIYTSDEFLKVAPKYFNVQLSRNSVAEVRRVREIENDREEKIIKDFKKYSLSPAHIASGIISNLQNALILCTEIIEDDFGFYDNENKILDLVRYQNEIYRNLYSHITRGDLKMWQAYDKYAQHIRNFGINVYEIDELPTSRMQELIIINNSIVHSLQKIKLSKLAGLNKPG